MGAKVEGADDGNIAERPRCFPHGRSRLGHPRNDSAATRGNAKRQALGSVLPVRPFVMAGARPAMTKGPYSRTFVPQHIESDYTDRGRLLSHL